MKGKRELKKDCTEFLGLSENVETDADGALVLAGGARIVSELLPEFGGENKSGIGGYALDPKCGVIGTQRLVKGSIDLDRVEKLGEIRGLVKSFWAARRVDVTSPIAVGPAGRSDAKVAFEAAV